MQIEQRIQAGRRRAESLMVDTCEVVRSTGGYTVDPETGQDIPAVEVVYPVGDEDGRCKLSSTPQTGSQLDSDQYRFSIESPRLHLPITANVRAGDRVRITHSHMNPVNTGWEMGLRDLNRGTFRTAQRWNLEVVTR